MRTILCLMLVCACSASHASLRGDEASSAENSQARDGSPLLAHRGEASLEREDPEKGPDAAAKLAAQHGGYVSLMQERSVTLQVPGDQVDALLAELPTLGKVTSRRFEALDVTSPRRDLKARIDNLSRERSRYLDLLAAATTISDAAAVEREVERVTGELEAMEARMAALDARVADASLRLDFSHELKPGPIGLVFYALASGVKWLFVWN
jgi:Domain of unknown function (DUF4349)